MYIEHFFKKSNMLKFPQVDFEWAMKLNRVSLQLIGLWPKTEKISRRRLKHDLLALSIFLMFVVGVLIPYIQSLIKFRRNILQVMEHLQFILPFTTCAARIGIFWWKKEAIIPVMNMIAEDWTQLKDLRERKMMIRWAQRARIVITIAFSIMSVSYICVVFLPAFGISIIYEANMSTNSDKLLPLHAYHIYNLTKSPLYELTYISHAVFFFFSVITYTGIDNFLGLLVCHICGQIDILRTRFMCLDKPMRFRNGLRNCVIHHLRLLRAIDMIEDTYNVILLALFLYFGILFAFYGFIIIKIFEENNDALIRLPFLIANVMNLFIHMALYCTVGEILVARYNRIHYAIYDQEWYTLDTKKLKDLVILMIKSREPPYITTGKILPLTIVTFCNLVKSSVGYVSVLYKTRH